MEDAVSHLPSLVLNADRVEKSKNGLSTRIDDAKFDHGKAIQMVDASGDLIAIGVYDEAEKSIRPKVVLV